MATSVGNRNSKVAFLDHQRGKLISKKKALPIDFSGKEDMNSSSKGDDAGCELHETRRLGVVARWSSAVAVDRGGELERRRGTSSSLAAAQRRLLTIGKGRKPSSLPCRRRGEMGDCWPKLCLAAGDRLPLRRRLHPPATITNGSFGGKTGDVGLLKSVKGETRTTEWTAAVGSLHRRLLERSAEKRDRDGREITKQS
nr:hypothetical protein Iba_chr02cCG11600 [Ipomoea batatas]